MVEDRGLKIEDWTFDPPFWVLILGYARDGKRVQNVWNDWNFLNDLNGG